MSMKNTLGLMAGMASMFESFADPSLNRRRSVEVNTGTGMDLRTTAKSKRIKKPNTFKKVKKITNSQRWAKNKLL